MRRSSVARQQVTARSGAHSLLKLLGEAGERQLALAGRLQRLEGAADVWLPCRHPCEHWSVGRAGERGS